MTDILQEKHDNIHLDYSFLMNKLEKIGAENSLYKKAFLQIEDVAQKVASGDISARIVHWDDFGDLTPTLSAINDAYDLIGNIIIGMKEVQKISLQNQDDFRRKQLEELKTEFIENIVPILK